MRLFFRLFRYGAIFLIALNTAQTLHAQQYEKAWQRVEAFAKKNRPGSAFIEVRQIYEQAKKDQQDAQVIKALLYMGGLQSENREDNELFFIAEIEKDIINSREPTKSILQSLLAEAYWSYFKIHRWTIYSRTNTENYKSYDIATWTTNDFHKKITETYLASVQNESLLQATPVEAYDDILIKGNARVLRPTLYDLLVHRAIDYFRNTERDIVNPAFSLDLDSSIAFLPAADFIRRLSDSASLQHPALFLLRKLLKFHLTDENPAALIDADILRISFLGTSSINENGDSLYYKALETIANKYDGYPAADQAWYLMASENVQSAATWQPFGDTAHRYDKLLAKSICEHVLQNKKDSEGRTNCQNLLNTITLASVSFNMEKVNIRGKPFRVYANYINTKRVYLHILKYDRENETVSSMPVIRTWEQQLPVSGDMQLHHAEIKVDGLPSGRYILDMSTKADFSEKEAVVARSIFHVSNISYISDENDYFILERESGQPLVNASVQVWFAPSDNAKTLVKGKSYTTDTNGYVKIDPEFQVTKSKYFAKLTLEITHKDDRLFGDDWSSTVRSYSSNNTPWQPAADVFLFTDRAIYRPGQTVYFKGIVLQKDSTERSGKVLADHPMKVILRTPNRQLIDSVSLTSNEFGSFNASFHLPASGITGNFQIFTRDDVGLTRFVVEEYKRPKFSANYEPVKGTYQLSDSIHISGVATAFAGNSIDGAEVKYRVVRRARFIYDWLFWKHTRPTVSSASIAAGKVSTDDNGRFTIVFKAEPDLTIDRKMDPVFDYTITADVTDINGETHTVEKIISVAYSSLLIQSDLPEVVPTDSLQTIPVTTENRNGEFIPTTLHVRIDKLKDEKRLIRERMWARPDEFIISKEQYLIDFPYDEYDNERDPKNRPVEKTVHEKDYVSVADGFLNVQTSSLVPGFYQITFLAKDKNGNEVKEIKFVELYDARDNHISNAAYLWLEKIKPIEPGQTTQTILGTSANQTFILQQISKGTRSLWPRTKTYSFLRLDDEKRSLSFTATEEDRGGYGVRWAFIKHNRFYKAEQIVNVPWTDKYLSIEYESFRNKTEPGSSEKWKIKIKGSKNKLVAAEVLASMYDASLDELYPHQWRTPNLWTNYYSGSTWGSDWGFASIPGQPVIWPQPVVTSFQKHYDVILSTYIFSPHLRNKKSVDPLFWLNPLDYAYSDLRNPRLMRLPKPVFGLETQAKFAAANGAILPDSDGDGITDQFDTEYNPLEKASPTDQVKTRKNFNETAFFYPVLRTDSTGTVEISFTIPESLTKWKFQALAHTKDLATGTTQKYTITQKQLMVQPNMPRFVRQEDIINLSCKIVNLAEQTSTGKVTLQLSDGETGIPIDADFQNAKAEQNFTVQAGKSMVVNFPVHIPANFTHTLQWKIIAKTDRYSDGEENIIPVLSNRLLVTESLPLNMTGVGTTAFRFEKLLASGKSPTLQHNKLTIEYTSNPIWYAVQSLPYLMEYPYECAEQTWNRYYGNSLAMLIANSSPRIKQAFEQWKIQDTAALMSNLEKRQELKSLLLVETPWVLQAKSETAQKKNIALLFDMVKMSGQLNSAYNKLQQLQTSSGGFSWFAGGDDDQFITQYILSGIGHLEKLNAIAVGEKNKLKTVVNKAFPYLDELLRKDYADLVKRNAKMNESNIGYLEIQNLYAHSFFPDQKLAEANQKAYDYFYKQAKTHWGEQNKYMQGMIALCLYRSGDKKTALDILQSLKETAIVNKDLGTYWKDQSDGWYWQAAPIETQSLLVEAFREISNDEEMIDGLRTWLLRNKQTNSWHSTKATAEACYALLMPGAGKTTTVDALNNEPAVDIKLNGRSIVPDSSTQKNGSGYMSNSMDGKEVQPQLGNITVSIKPNAQSPSNTIGTSWGSAYWQYFEDLDKITAAASPLQLSKQLFVEKNNGREVVIVPVQPTDTLHVGDKLKVRIVLKADRNMEYIHLKDMRASSLEPINVLSRYKYQDGLGYYESTRDASTNFFFPYLKKGTYVFEYSLFVTHAGHFNNGIATIQSMYAPEFTSHSEGVQITVK